jgi:hypothetical protein
MPQLQLTLQGRTITIQANLSGLVRVGDGERYKSFALPKLAKAVVSNPNAVSVEETENGAILRLPDGTAFVLRADSLVITPATPSVSAQLTQPAPQPTPQQTPVASGQVAAGKEVTAMAQEQPTVAPANGTTKVGRRAKFVERLQAVLAQQGISDAQIAAIVEALRPRRDGRSETDPIVKAVRKVMRSLRPGEWVKHEGDGFVFEVHHDRATITLPGGQTFTVTR